MARSSTTFGKGQSGNPAGRPKEVADIRAAAREHSKAAIETLRKIATSGRSEMAKLAAANSLLDRGFGRPTQMVGSDPEFPMTPLVQVYVPDNGRQRPAPTPTPAPTLEAQPTGGNGAH